MPGPPGAAACSQAPPAPRRRHLDRGTGVVAAGPPVRPPSPPSSPPISPRASAAWQRTVSSASCNKPINPGATAAAPARFDPVPGPPGSAPPPRRRPGPTRASPRPARSGRGAVAGSVAFSTRQTARSLDPATRVRPGQAAAARGAGARTRAAQDPQRLDHALPHHVAGVLGRATASTGTVSRAWRWPSAAATIARTSSCGSCR